MFKLSLCLIAALIVCAHAVDQDQDATIVRQDVDVNADSYTYKWETSNGISAQSQGDANSQTGSYQYTAPDGQVISVQYVADENGYQPTGAHLPTPPPV